MSKPIPHRRPLPAAPSLALLVSVACVAAQLGLSLHFAAEPHAFRDGGLYHADGAAAHGHEGVDAAPASHPAEACAWLATLSPGVEIAAPRAVPAPPVLPTEAPALAVAVTLPARAVYRFAPKHGPPAA